MAYSFCANFVFSSDDGDITMVAFSNDEFEPSQFVMLQQSNKYDDQDKKMGMDKIYIQVEDQSRSHYGGITKIVMMESLLVIGLEESAQARLQIEGSIEITMNTRQLEFSAALSQLERMAQKENVPFVKSA
ncbi:Imm10 family immunity protein [Methylomonas montana]|uniref:Imm10 family immunity protein n=1 Tax=Methylomonas montana TaxID=3058963 RepID=UPI0026597952|nr:Imm10 family immunity protein [Methylomonas montana]WKJ90894.1 Imm10 family immunity protein [Methylomonas montana]